MGYTKQRIESFKIQVHYHSNPTIVFNQLCKNRHSTLLLESSEIQKQRNIESMMIIDSALRISAYNTNVIIQALTKNGANLLSVLEQALPNTVKVIKTHSTAIKLKFPITQNTLDEDSQLKSISIFDGLRSLLKIMKPPQDNPKSVFLGGLFAYDLITCFEPIPKLTDYPQCPDYCFYLSEILLIFDHQKHTAELNGTLFHSDTLEKNRLKNRMNELKKQINRTLCTTIPYITVQNMTLSCNQNDTSYKKNIHRIQNFIRQGEILQAVPSRCFFLPCPSPLAAYHTLKINNPSPYMFFMQDKVFTLFGASPESSLKYDANTRKIEIYPIAGTRARVYHDDGSLDIDSDNRIELEMRLNQKELSEHLMLVDLARNDLARICKTGSRYISELLQVDRYSYVMHLVSKVVGELSYNFDILHAYRACMNMGTLTGAPKIKAMQIIYEVEKKRRNAYGGAIGYLVGSGSLDTCIIIRAAYVVNNLATVQAGAGIVLDSIPQSEADESRNKAKAVLQAIAIAHNSKEIFS
ncbi:anthranilate synthase component I [Candidatus Blochmanniella vafra str. BVAF]|uniref:Anthranilate synthase component 1 n=2 Tax=Candidatus Blochmanniella vafra TaxID=251535 RepID=E8Q6C2_BLOVB|nr:anthranilate synthase component 1 [Candidatus Blochmannia vafer]ADR83548.1 anthranilate synthase component I [Candidatus Blochmannia vafer]ADR83549.1 anthranilate synthase component I [Candidatus Blochmannia vafer]ADR83550.1 anthranilate synthase component I [Candidatus Blochmannia vafer]ADR83551.1 anthranilate synthase component I [Candidatus Blochmannia vafer]ADR83553.1 anthranilate synthase component I [Candidatus Blochmannia vafer]